MREPFGESSLTRRRGTNKHKQSNQGPSSHIGRRSEEASIPLFFTGRMLQSPIGARACPVLAQRTKFNYLWICIKFVYFQHLRIGQLAGSFKPSMSWLGLGSFYKRVENFGSSSFVYLPNRVSNELISSPAMSCSSSSTHLQP